MQAYTETGVSAEGFKPRPVRNSVAFRQIAEKRQAHLTRTPYSPDDSYFLSSLLGANVIPSLQVSSRRLMVVPSILQQHRLGQGTSLSWQHVPAA